ncbi:MAG: methylated-DNA--[protein]-cysteine S-methyltransferase [Planctomycetota bacterium]|jgi:methylated-DNA-[protein]-cysteine S-methyltransferase
MQKATKYTIFKTRWGHFGLAGTEYGLLRTYLPRPDYEKIKCRLISDLDAAQFDKGLFKTLQKRISDYFDGTCINFDKDIPVITDGLSFFAGRVLDACRDIKFGQTISYGRLAEKIGKAGAARAVGGALAKNPLPLIIPCHRVVCANGGIGGFSAAGGVTIKKRMLELERKNSLIC